MGKWYILLMVIIVLSSVLASYVESAETISPLGLVAGLLPFAISLTVLICVLLGDNHHGKR